MAKGDLTARQRRFVEEYAIDMNGAAAYRRAGYRARTDDVAAVSASKLLRNPKVSAAVEAARKARSDRTEITQDLVLQGLYAETQKQGRDTSPVARVKALELLGRHVGMWPSAPPVGKDGFTAEEREARLEEFRKRYGSQPHKLDPTALKDFHDDCVKAGIPVKADDRINQYAAAYEAEADRKETTSGIKTTNGTQETRR